TPRPRSARRCPGPAPDRRCPGPAPDRRCPGPAPDRRCPGAMAIPAGVLRPAPWLLRELLELAVVDPALLAALEQLLGRQVLQAAKAVLDRLLEVLGRLRVVAMRAAERLGHDLVDDAERLQARRGDAEAFGRLARVLRALPQDGRAALGRDHRVGRVLHH